MCHVSRNGLPVLVLAASLLTSCSYVTIFVVVNDGPGPVTVTWTFVPPQGSEGGGYCPITQSDYDAAVGEIVGSWLRGDRYERRGPPPGFRVDAEACRATATMGSGVALRLHREINFVATNPMDRQLLDRLRVEIQGSAGATTVEPGQAFERMTRRADLLYVLTCQ